MSPDNETEKVFVLTFTKSSSEMLFSDLLESETLRALLAESFAANAVSWLLIKICHNYIL